MLEKVELRASLSTDNATVTLEMLVEGKSVAKLPMSAQDLDYQINALTRLRQGMSELS